MSTATITNANEPVMLTVRSAANDEVVSQKFVRRFLYRLVPTNL